MRNWAIRAVAHLCPPATCVAASALAAQFCAPALGRLGVLRRWLERAGIAHLNDETERSHRVDTGFGEQGQSADSGRAGAD